MTVFNKFRIIIDHKDTQTVPKIGICGVQQYSFLLAYEHISVCLTRYQKNVRSIQILLIQIDADSRRVRKLERRYIFMRSSFLCNYTARVTWTSFLLALH